MTSKNFNRAFAFVLAFCMLCTVPVMAEETELTVYPDVAYISINGTVTDTNNYANEQGFLYAPLRAVCEGFGYPVIWNEDRSIDITTQKVQEPKLNKTEYIMPQTQPAVITGYVNELTIRINEKQIETPHLLYNDTTYVPVSFFQTALNCYVYVDFSLGIAKIYAPDFVTFQEDEVMYLNGTMLTQTQYQDIATFLSQAMGGADVTPDVMVSELDYFCAVRQIGEKIVGDEGFDQFFMQNNFDTLMTQMGISDKEVFRDIILTVVYYEYILDASSLMAYYTPTEEDYEKQLDQSAYKSGHWMKAKHILIMKTEDDSAKKQAEEILAELRKNPEKFDELMNQYSEDPGSKTYPEGYLFTQGQMVDEFYNGTLPLKVNEISELVESQYGYHIILKVQEFENGVPYTEVKNELHQTFAQEQLNIDLNKAMAQTNIIVKKAEQ